MTDDNSVTDGTQALDSSKRRRLLAAVGAAATATIAGCSGSEGSATPTPTQASPADSVEPRFGYVGTAGSSPPVEADHTVDLNIRPRENVEIPEFFFEPTGLAIEPGDTVRFNMATPHHNINAFHPAFGYTQRVPEGTPPYSSPILTAGDYWLYTFENEGVHNIACAPHEVFGMVGSIVVGSPTGPGANPVGEAPAPSPQSRHPEFTAGTVLSDPAMDPENIAEQGSVSWSEIADENKQLLLAPVGEE